ncbi:MAG: rRNA maturation RNase YbeY [Bacteroidetes bacterium]|nr:rRNA maturation RNase YbeY [Bacteroidota bacterium]
MLLAGSEKKEIKKLSYHFCSDEALLHINQQFLAHDFYTDIITFDYNEKNKIVGEIYVSADRVADNAKKADTAFEVELLRVLAHGLLHLCGYKDKTPMQKKQMRQAEDKAMLAFNKTKQLE